VIALLCPVKDRLSGAVSYSSKENQCGVLLGYKHNFFNGKTINY
jgi:hypothetical protein